MENNKKPDAENLLQVCDIYKSFGDNAADISAQCLLQ